MLEEMHEKQSLADRILEFRLNCERVEKHHGIVNHKFAKKDAQWILDHLGIEGVIVGGNFFSTPTPFIIHTDTGKQTDKIRPTHNILIPLTEAQDFHTVVFDQTYSGDAAHFMVGSLFKYWPDPVYNLRKENFDDVDGCVKIGCVNNKHLSHLPMETIEQLSIKRIYKWKVGNPIIFKSNHLHCGGNFVGRKEGLSLLISSQNIKD